MDNTAFRLTNPAQSVPRRAFSTFGYTFRRVTGVHRCDSQFTFGKAGQITVSCLPVCASVSQIADFAASSHIVCAPLGGLCTLWPVACCLGRATCQSEQWRASNQKSLRGESSLPAPTCESSASCHRQREAFKRWLWSLASRIHPAWLSHYFGGVDELAIAAGGYFRLRLPPWTGTQFRRSVS